MSRSNYSYDLEQPFLAMWRGQVASAIRGKRGQKFLSDLLAALDAMPEKVLIANELQDIEGNVCAIGALGKARGVDMARIDPEDYDQVADAFDIAHQLAQEVEYMNDEYMNDERLYGETPQNRWRRMRDWVAGLIAKEATQ